MTIYKVPDLTLEWYFGYHLFYPWAVSSLLWRPTQHYLRWGEGEGEPKDKALLFQSTVTIHFQNMHKILFQSTVDIHFQKGAQNTLKLRRLALCVFIANFALVDCATNYCFSNRNWKRICFSTAVLSDSVDPYIMKELISFLYYYYYTAIISVNFRLQVLGAGMWSRSRRLETVSRPIEGLVSISSRACKQTSRSRLGLWS